MHEVYKEKKDRGGSDSDFVFWTARGREGGSNIDI